MGILRRREGLRIPDVRLGLPADQRDREHPAYDGLSKRNVVVADTFARNYANFLNKARIASEVVSEVGKMYAISKPENSFYMTNDDETAFAIGLFGNAPAKEGINVIYAHTDSPCLRAKPNPIRIEWDIDTKEMHTGAEIDTFGYGGIIPHQWTGRSLEMRGWTFRNGRKHNLPRVIVYSSEVCAHTDDRPGTNISFDEAHSQEGLDLVTGFRDERSLLKALGLKSKNDFGFSTLLFVPIEKPQFVGPYFLSGYGHDNRSCVYSSVRAALENKVKRPTIVIGFDKEEIGSVGPGGAKGLFFEEVFYRLLLENKDVRRRENVSSQLERSIFSKSLAIDADTDVGATTKEIGIVDLHSVARLGFGVFINATDGTYNGDQLSGRTVEKVMTYLGRRNTICQIIGAPLGADNSHIVPSANEFFVNRGFPTINVGIPVGSLHSPAEILHKGDLFSAYQAYKALIEQPNRKE